MCDVHCRMLGANFGAMVDMGDPVLKPFLQVTALTGRDTDVLRQHRGS